MERLEIRESNFSKTLENKDFRIDSQFYTQEPKKNKTLVYDKIGNVLEKAQYGVSISMNEDNLGYPIYRMNEIHTMMCDLEVGKSAELSSNEMETFRLNDRDVLFNRTNSFEWVGRTGLYKKQDDRDFVFASYLVRFIPNQNKILPEYMVAFLSSKQGIWDVKRRARQSINQTNVNPEEVKNIDIPILSFSIQMKIKDCFDNAHENKLISAKKYTQAEEILFQEIGLLDFQPSKEQINVKSFKESFGASGRLDAEYYQKKFEDVIEKIKSQRYHTLKHIVSISKSIEPGSNSYSDDETGLPFMRVSDYDKFGLTEPNKRLTFDFVKENQDKIDVLKPKKGTILFSKDGSVGTAYHLREDFEGVNSGAILHLKVKNQKEVLPEYLTLALNSKVVKMQAERDAGGSIILHWRVGEIENVIVPIIDFDKQKQIAELVEESFKLKKQGEQLLEIAKRSVEIAIEENEAKALKYIEQNMV
ncbi:restriction endonuclease subunit S [Flavobacterium sp. M31R6]|uniref:restriction endonuclease subunit S n=1 Tax=Flavobacterium sp. M31R6 TaxID=2739062 RepID=UPI001568D9BF|nr:restriction endonuclease subunit S [Flavobacterium sp. M31R6]QKJ61612.1 restriction endonuclease subunit S [Flavobacterium sp. M31R6]